MPSAHEVHDLDLAEDGLMRMRWSERQMPVLATIREQFGREDIKFED